MSTNDERELACWMAEEGDSKVNDLEAEYNLSDIRKAVEQIDRINLPALDLDESWQVIEQKRTNWSLRPLRIQAWTIAVAASILVILGIFFITSDSSQTYLVFTESELAELPDGSFALFKEGAEIQFDDREPRLLDLKGSAYFHVKPGDPFEVSGEKGQVRVLGTSFEVVQDEKFSVNCFTGKVQVISELDEEFILGPGEGISIDEEGLITRANFDETAPAWTKERSLQSQMNFADLMTLLELEYDINIENPEQINPRFRGSLPFDDLELVIEILESTLSIKLIETDSRTYVIKK